MSKATQCLFCTAALLCPCSAHSQAGPETNSQALPAVQPSASGAYVYLASGTQGSANLIAAYSASAQGVLSHIADIGVPASMRTLSVNASFLFASSGTTLYSFRRTASGSLTLVSTLDASSLADQPCVLASTQLDHSGSTLYVSALSGGLCEGSTYESFAINKTTGALTFLSSAPAPIVFTAPPSFIGSNLFAYAAECTNYRGGLLGNLVGYQRLSTGELSEVLSNPPTPLLPADESYCPGQAAADPTRHVAVTLTAYAFQDPNEQVAPTQIASYTADGSGGLTTTNTAASMPYALPSYIGKLAMAPSGKLLAVSGFGLQLFHFNGAAPADSYSNLLTADQIYDTGWDNANHLYAIFSATGLHVFTATSGGVSEALGSPYSVPVNGAIAILPVGPAVSDTPAPVCAPPLSGVHLCSPASAAAAISSAVSPVYVSASATATSGNLTAFRVYVDNIAQTLVSLPTKAKSFTIHEAVVMPPGTHQLVVVAYESTGAAMTASRRIVIH